MRCLHVSGYTWVLCSVATAVTCCALSPRVRLHLGVVFSCHCCHVLCALSTCPVTPGCCVQLPLLSRVVRSLHVSGHTWVLCSVATAVTCCALSPRVWSHLSVVFSCHCCHVLCALSTCLVTPECCVQLPLLSRVVRSLHVSGYTWVLCSFPTDFT